MTTYTYLYRRRRVYIESCIGRNIENQVKLEKSPVTQTKSKFVRGLDMEIDIIVIIIITVMLWQAYIFHCCPSALCSRYFYIDIDIHFWKRTDFLFIYFL